MSNVFQRPGDPYIYLSVNGVWYCYNPTDPPLGGGSMGTVYKGYNVDTKERVAIKRVIDRYSNNTMIRERAKLEASLAFRHKNLVEMIGYCEYDNNHGPIFILSKYVNGENVDKFIARLPDTPDKIEKICRIMYMILDALEYIHSKGVVHRDIKPSNIMVEQGSNVRLMDLGIARMNSGNSFSLLGFIGTPQYSAPEQILREKSDTDDTSQICAATDIYALGITMYELITGVNPFKSDNDAETLTRQMKDTLPSDKKIPSKLLAVLRKATDKSVCNRYQTATEFKLAIEDSLKPTLSWWQKLVKWLKNN